MVRDGTLDGHACIRLIHVSDSGLLRRSGSFFTFHALSDGLALASL